MYFFADWTTRVKQIAKLWRKASSQERAPYVVFKQTPMFEIFKHCLNLSFIVLGCFIDFLFVENASWYLHN